MAKGVCRFAGINQVVSAEMCWSAGISPSHCVIQCAPQAQIDSPDGVLVFLFGGVEIPFPDCRVDAATVKLDQNGFITSLHILDWRWKWAFGEISGTYNTHFGNGLAQPGQIAGTLDKTYARTPRQLALLCLRQMGVKRYDVLALPTDSYPPVQWDGENPAQALANLCDQFGCRVVQQLDQSVLIAKVGDGGPLPDGPLENDSLGAKLSRLPDAILTRVGKTRRQGDFKLFAIGLDLDGTILPINQLSYAPRNSDNKIDWSQESPDAFGGLDDTKDAFGQSPRSLALQTVWRWYQLAAPDTSGDRLVVPGYKGKLFTIRQVLPIEDEQVQQPLANVGSAFQYPNGISRNLSAWVYGTFCYRNFNATPNAAFPQLYNKNFSINRDAGIVEFSDPVYQQKGDGSIQPADLYLRTALSVRDAETFSWERVEVGVPTGGNGNTGALVLLHDEIALNVIGVYDTSSSPPKLKKTTDNYATVKTEAIYYLRAALAELQVSTAADRTYAGLLPINLDGAIQQVSWSVGQSGARTRASLNHEHNPFVAPYRERRFYERLRGQVGRQLIDLAAKLRNSKDPIKGVTGL